MRSAMSWRTLLTLVLLVAAVASGWSVWRLSHNGDEDVLNARPDYVLRDYEITSLDKRGKESFTLRGPVLQREPADKTMTLQTPLFLVPDRSGKYWEVRAKQGTVPADGKQLDLRGTVHAASPAGVAPETRIETSQLSLFPQENRASSQTAVTVTRPGLTMRGVGMQADFDRQQVSLLSQVRTRYVPQP